MSEISWDNPEMKAICGECHFKDADPELCHGIEPPIKKPFVPPNISACFFVRESHWQRMPEEYQARVEDVVRWRSELYYSKKDNK